jgi:hypothetical protein
VNEPTIVRASFDYSLDEAVDANTRFMRGSAVGQAVRRRSIRSTGVALAALLFAFAAFNMTSPTPGALISAALVSIAAGIVGATIHAVMYDWAIRRRVRRFVRDHVNEANVLRCEIELRPDGAWVRQPYGEMLFDWGEAVAVTDPGDAIELHFERGFVLARNRAFATAAERESFLSRARALASNSRS